MFYEIFLKDSPTLTIQTHIYVRSKVCCFVVPFYIHPLKVSLHIRGLLRVFTPPETLHENALFALIDL